MATLNGYPITSLGLPVAPNGESMEPSGLAIIPSHPWLFMVSDNGAFAKTALPHTSSPTWLTTNPTDDHADDFESVSVVGANGAWTMVGVEGYRQPSQGAALTMPSIRRYDANFSSPVASFQNETWILQMPVTPPTTQEGDGMEAMTWVPPDAIPSSWGLSAANTMPFFMAVQASSTLYVFLFPTTNIKSTQTVTCAKQITVPQPTGVPSGKRAKISDMYFDPSTSVLYVLYDGGADSDYLQALRLSSSGALQQINSTTMPWLGCEGITVQGDTLYFCTDDGKSSNSNDGVYAVPGFIPSFIGAQ